MKKNEMVGVWNHDEGREDTGVIVDIKKIRSKYNNQLDNKYFVLIDGTVYELYDFQIFSPGKATKNKAAISLGKCFWSKQGKYERVSMIG